MPWFGRSDASTSDDQLEEEEEAVGAKEDVGHKLFLRLKSGSVPSADELREVVRSDGGLRRGEMARVLHYLALAQRFRLVNDGGAQDLVDVLFEALTTAEEDGLTPVQAVVGKEVDVITEGGDRLRGRFIGYDRGYERVRVSLPTDGEVLFTPTDLAPVQPTPESPPQRSRDDWRSSSSSDDMQEVETGEVWQRIASEDSALSADELRELISRDGCLLRGELETVLGYLRMILAFKEHGPPPGCGLGSRELVEVLLEAVTTPSSEGLSPAKAIIGKEVGVVRKDTGVSWGELVGYDLGYQRCAIGISPPSTLPSSLPPSPTIDLACRGRCVVSLPTDGSSCRVSVSPDQLHFPATQSSDDDRVSSSSDDTELHDDDLPDFVTSLPKVRDLAKLLCDAGSTPDAWALERLEQLLGGDECLREGYVESVLGYLAILDELQAAAATDAVGILREALTQQTPDRRSPLLAVMGKEVEVVSSDRTGERGILAGFEEGLKG